MKISGVLKTCHPAERGTMNSPVTRSECSPVLQFFGDLFLCSVITEEISISGELDIHGLLLGSEHLQ
jgi:hypothetical protein